jgi:hypothetical protein
VAACELTMNVTHAPPERGDTVAVSLDPERATVFPG